MIALTDSASTKVKQLMEEEGCEQHALRVAVRPGGHSGFAYELFFDADVATDDQAAEFGGVRVVADPSSARMLAGATLDYLESPGETGFSITNPNAGPSHGGCGCGGGGHGHGHGGGGGGCGCGGGGHGHGEHSHAGGGGCGCGGHGHGEPSRAEHSQAGGCGCGSH